MYQHTRLRLGAHSTLAAWLKGLTATIAVGAVVWVANTNMLASGHGPVFGMATPTNAAGGWTIDVAAMGRGGTSDQASTVRTMISYGWTEDLQLSASAPYVFSSAPLAPARMTGMMPGGGDFEGILAWRFHRQGTNIGSRFESTAYGGLIMPGPQKPAGFLGTFNRAPGAYAAVASGIASRSHYVWGGLGYGASDFSRPHDAGDLQELRD